ncbi:Cell cycle-regulated histone H1-binding protein [Phaffia rhodozyma]|uniref:Cell cycle-regulated histone H1-binding protein n=1 Tax=Phaffia rhodozyma TaxID=264483 RepID=A0A0F7SRD7_PHARH|nr:Cell cycle-regulated histone H1-binding protein [Phaffia rhodozyma]
MSSTDSSTQKDLLQANIDLGNKAFVLRKWDEAADAFTTALEICASIYGDFSAESADLLLSYGKALLEIATAQNQVMRQEAGANGGEDGGSDDDQDEVEEEALQIAASTASNVNNHFDFREETQDVISTTIPIISATSSSSSSGAADTVIGGTALSNDSATKPSGEPEEEDPEDDFNAAWDVLDSARALFQKKEGGLARLQEAECYLTLGDVSLETENFAQAVEDFQSALALKSPILPNSSRHISEAHLKLAVALEFASMLEDHQARALGHVELSKASLLERRAELESGVSGFEVGPEESIKGKGKEGKILAEDVVKDRVEKLSEEERKAETKEIDELLEDLDLKIEDLRMAPLPKTNLAGLLPTSSSTSTSTFNAFGGPFSSSVSAETSVSASQVNDLSSMVKKRKTAAAASSSSSPATGKRKADSEGSGGEKKAKI